MAVDDGIMLGHHFPTGPMDVVLLCHAAGFSLGTRCGVAVRESYTVRLLIGLTYSSFTFYMAEEAADFCHMDPYVFCQWL